MATNIQYNDVVMLDVLTEGIEYSNESDSTGVDPIYTKVRVTISTMIHTFVGATLGTIGGTLLGHSITSVIERLMVPRGYFRMTVGGVAIFDVRPATFGGGPLNSRDVNNGPKPTVEVQKIISNTSARIRFTIELAIPNCTANGPGYLNLRFWIADDIDGNWRTTRTYRGRLRVATKAYSPQWFRNVIMPPLQSGFKREAINLHESDNGLELDFEIRDVEVYAAPPFPATTWRGHHMVVSPYAGGVLCESEVRVELEGPNSVHKTRLIALAAHIIDKKLDYLKKRPQGQSNSILPLYIAFNEDLAENRVEATARVRHTGHRLIFAAELSRLGHFLPADVNAPVGYKPNEAPAPVPTATLAGLFVSAIQGPCAPATMPKDRPTGTVHPAITGLALGPTVNLTFGPLPPWELNQTPDQEKAPYLQYIAESDIAAIGGAIALPVARVGSGSTPAQRRRRESSGSTVSIIQLHSGITHRTVSIDAERVSDWPKLPQPVNFTDSNGIVHTVLDHNISPVAPSLAGDSLTDIFGSRMTINYVLSRPPRAGESLPVGNLPYRTPTQGAVPTDQIPYRYFVEPKSIVAAGGSQQ